MSDLPLSFQLQADRDAFEVLQAQLLKAVSDRPDDLDHFNGLFSFQNGFTIRFFSLPNDVMDEFDLAGISFTNPNQIKVMGPFLDVISTPIQMTFKTGGDIVILPAAAIKEYGPANSVNGTYTISQLSSLSHEALHAIFALGAVREDDGSPSIIHNGDYDDLYDVTSGIEPGENELIRSQYEFIFATEAISVEDIFFRVLGLEKFTLYDDKATAAYADEAKSVRILAYKVSYNEGSFWTLSVFIPDQGAMRDAALTDLLVRHTKSTNDKWRIFAILSSDDVGETTTVQEYILRNDAISEGQFRTFLID